MVGLRRRAVVGFVGLSFLSALAISTSVTASAKAHCPHHVCTTTTTAATTTTVVTTTTSSSTTTTQPGTDVQPAFPIRAAFYYPWFPEAWTQNGIFPYSNYTPSLGFYDSSDASVLATHVSEMRNAGLEAAIASWWGQGTKTDSRIPALLNAAAGTTFRWSLYYEPEGISDPTVSQIQSDLAYIDAHYGTQPTYLRHNGRPVLFVYADANDGCAMADRWAQANANKAFWIVLKVFSGYKTCASQPDGWHQYGPASATDNQSPYSYSISPGYWKVGESPRLARDTTTWTNSIASMVASGAQWELVTTFNEWGEGTQIEPATAYGTTYLDLLRDGLSGTTTTTTTTTTTIGTTTTIVTTTTTVPTTTTTQPTTTGICGNPGTPTLHQKVVVFTFENRTWSDVGGTQFQSMPYMNSLAKQCPTFADYTEPDTTQNSATQYVGQWAGSTANTVLNDCSPSSTCDSTQNNIGRQVRVAGMTVRSYVEGATSTCSASGNAAKHIPDLYFFGTYTDSSGATVSDHDFCNQEVVPYSQFDPNNLPDFSFVTPTLCNDGHDCGNSTVDAWAKANVQPVLDSAAYKAGNVTVFIWYDEDHPVPNMQIGLHAIGGVKTTAINYCSTLRAWDELLGRPLLACAGTAVDIRSLAGI